jgi:hypothetical protein
MAIVALMYLHSRCCLIKLTLFSARTFYLLCIFLASTYGYNWHMFWLQPSLTFTLQSAHSYLLNITSSSPGRHLHSQWLNFRLRIPLAVIAVCITGQLRHERLETLKRIETFFEQT